MNYDNEKVPQSNLIGRRFGKLVVMEYVGYDVVTTRCGSQTHFFWKCKCDCGEECVTYTGMLTGHHKESCGCIKKGVDLTGKRFGRLIVIEESEPQKRKDGKGQKRVWKCLCDCGNITFTIQDLLVGGHSKSCGCLQREGMPPNPESVTRKYKRLYGIWRGIKDRCNNPKDQHHKDYYDRGIKVCEEWNNSFLAFLEWALTHGYADNLSIDRIDYNGNYEPSNCRWSTNKEQQNNKRNNVRYEVDGVIMTLSEIADKYGIKCGTLSARINRYGYTIDEAINESVKYGGRRKIKQQIDSKKIK